MSALHFKRKPFTGFGLLFSLILLLSGCSDHPLTPLQPKDKILAFGDSLTAGYGVKKSNSYPAILDRLLSQKVINTGISGETTAQGRKRFQDILEKHQPKLVILIEGGNDFLRNRPAEETFENLKWMIETAQSKGVEVLLVGVPPKKLFAGSHELYSELSEQMQVPLEEDIIPNLLLRPSMKSDYIHFNSQGYQALAEAIQNKLAELGAIEN